MSGRPLGCIRQICHSEAIPLIDEHAGIQCLHREHPRLCLGVSNYLGDTCLAELPETLESRI